LKYRHIEALAVEVGCVVLLKSIIVKMLRYFNRFCVGISTHRRFGNRNIGHRKKRHRNIGMTPPRTY
jgi:hypothetical protein